MLERGLRIGIEHNDVDVGMKFFDQRSKGPGAATDVEYSTTRLNLRLIEEGSPRNISTEQLHHGIVREAIASRGRRWEDRLWQS